MDGIVTVFNESQLLKALLRIRRTLSPSYVSAMTAFWIRPLYPTTSAHVPSEDRAYVTVGSLGVPIIASPLQAVNAALKINADRILHTLMNHFLRTWLFSLSYPFYGYTSYILALFFVFVNNITKKRPILGRSYCLGLGFTGKRYV